MVAGAGECGVVAAVAEHGVNNLRASAGVTKWGVRDGVGIHGMCGCWNVVWRAKCKGSWKQQRILREKDQYNCFNPSKAFEPRPTTMASRYFGDTVVVFQSL